MDRSKVDDEASAFMLGDLHECTRETREGIDGILFRAILEIDIELDRIEIMMVEVE